MILLKNSYKNAFVFSFGTYFITSLIVWFALYSYNPITLILELMLLYSVGPCIVMGMGILALRLLGFSKPKKSNRPKIALIVLAFVSFILAILPLCQPAPLYSYAYPLTLLNPPYNLAIVIGFTALISFVVFGIIFYVIAGKRCPYCYEWGALDLIQEKYLYTTHEYKDEDVYEPNWGWVEKRVEYRKDFYQRVYECKYCKRIIVRKEAETSRNY